MLNEGQSAASFLPLLWPLFDLFAPFAAGLFLALTAFTTWWNRPPAEDGIEAFFPAVTTQLSLRLLLATVVVVSQSD